MRPVTVIAALLLAAIALSLGCAPLMAPEPPWEKDAQALITHAETLFGKKQYEQAAKTVEGGQTWSMSAVENKAFAFVRAEKLTPSK